jgi:hypothetical protein
MCAVLNRKGGKAIHKRGDSHNIWGQKWVCNISRLEAWVQDRWTFLPGPSTLLQPR